MTNLNSQKILNSRSTCLLFSCYRTSPLSTSGLSHIFHAQTWLKTQQTSEKQTRGPCVIDFLVKLGFQSQYGDDGVPHSHIISSFHSPGKKTPGWRGGRECYTAANQEELSLTQCITLDEWVGLKGVPTSSLTLLFIKSVQQQQQLKFIYCK